MAEQIGWIVFLALIGSLGVPVLMAALAAYGLFPAFSVRIGHRSFAFGSMGPAPAQAGQRPPNPAGEERR